MKEILTILVFVLSLVSGNIKAQFFSYTIEPASCSACCDGMLTIEIVYCPTTSFNATSNSLTLTQTVTCCPNKFTYHNVCPSQYPFFAFPTELCASALQYVTMPFVTGIFEKQSEINKSILLYPNPVYNFLNVSLEDKLFKEFDQIKIIDLLGNPCHIQSNFSSGSERNNSNKTNLDVSLLKPGIYFLQIWRKGQLLSSLKFVKE
jgi:hypothetical protein